MVIHKIESPTKYIHFQSTSSVHSQQGHIVDYAMPRSEDCQIEVFFHWLNAKFKGILQLLHNFITHPILIIISALFDKYILVNKGTAPVIQNCQNPQHIK